MWGQPRWPWHRTPFAVARPALIGGMTHRILFVCLGNICRSPTAEAVTRAKAEARGLPLVLDSAGTGDWHIGKPPYAPMQGVARAAGYDLSMLRARQVARPDFQEFDLIIAMDEDNAATLAKWGPSDRIRKFTEFAPGSDAVSVPDPYFTRDFEGALALIETCADGLLDRLQKNAHQAS